MFHDEDLRGAAVASRRRRERLGREHSTPRLYDVRQRSEGQPVRERYYGDGSVMTRLTGAVIPPYNGDGPDFPVIRRGTCTFMNGTPQRMHVASSATGLDSRWTGHVETKRITGRAAERRGQ